VLIVEVVVVVLVLVAVATVAAGRGGPMWRPKPDSADSGLPTSRRLRATDVPGLSFRLAFRGYRMDDVDQALGQLREALADCERENAELEAAAPGETGRDGAGRLGRAGGSRPG
jgi:DivIVA domain-containing protein